MKKLFAGTEITLKPVDADDVEMIFTAIDSNREHLREWLPFVDATLSQQDTGSFIQSVVKSNCEKKDFLYCIFYKEKFAGLVGLKEVDHGNKKTEIGYWLIEEMQGKGIMLQSCRALMDYAFEELKLNRIQLKVALENKKSDQIPILLKLQYEGIERQGEWIENKFHDLKVYSILKKEWLKKKKTS
jgi:ribosomal-protein-serine acetyltransferase